MPEKNVGTSYEMTRQRFDQAGTAARYATRHGGHSRDRREQRCIAAALATIPKGSTVLDLPCGAGRLAPMLVEMGYTLTEADNSPHMVEQAKQAWEKSLAGNPAYAAAPAVKFEVRDVMKTGYPDETFDAIICNRLLHHFIEPATRVAALSELARISKGTIVASFFNSFAIDAVMFKVKNRLKSKIPDDRIPIAMNQFLADASDAGLQLDESFPTRWGVSPQWYVRLRKK